jgi:hypothetical protein
MIVLCCFPMCYAGSMDDIEKEIHRLEAYQKIHEKQLLVKEREYRRLTLLAALLGVATFASRYLAEIPNIQPYLQKAIVVGTAVVIISLFIAFFVSRAQQSPLGVKGYLRLEKTLLINEIPNILQILSLLGFLNVLLKQEAVKLGVSVVITFLLIIYLTSRRQDMVSESPSLKDKITPEVTAPLSIVLGCLFGAVVYGLASLISIQIK